MPTSGRSRLSASSLAAAASLLLVTGSMLPAALGQPRPPGARQFALAGAGAALEHDLWSAGNPAGWSGLGERAVALFALDGFGLRALRQESIRLVWPFSRHVVAAGVHAFGPPGYRETTLEAGYARALGLGSARPLHVGLRIAGRRAVFDGYGGTSRLAVSAGLQLRLTHRVVFGVAAANLNRPVRPGADLPRTLVAGLAARLHPALRVVADLEKNLLFPASMRGGLEATPDERITLWFGSGSFPARTAAGFRLALGHLRTSFAAERHPYLGWTPALGLTVAW